MPTYEKFKKNVGVRCIRWGYVFHKLRARYNTLAYAGERCHTSNLSKFLAHLSRRLKGELIVYPGSGVRRRRRRCSPFSNMNISEASWQIAIKFYLKHHWGGGKAAWGFGADQFRTLVSMATDSSHRVIMGKTASSSFLECF